MHPFERRMRDEFEINARAAATAIGCDLAHVIGIASEQMKVLARGVENARVDPAIDISEARGHDEIERLRKDLQDAQAAALTWKMRFEVIGGSVEDSQSR